MHFFDSRQSSGDKKVRLRLTVVSCHLATIRRTVDHDGAGPGAVAATRDTPEVGRGVASGADDGNVRDR